MIDQDTIENIGVQILIAEDSSTQAMSLQYLLEQQGYGVVVCENGRKALDSARLCKPTLVISDIVMPELDGYGLCRALKSDPDLAKIPVLLVTTLSDPEDVLRGLDSGADSFILKPYDDSILLNRIRFVLLQRQLRLTDRADMGVEISFNGRSHFITSDRLQILNLLLSTYEAAIQRNDELRRSEDELRQANDALSATNVKLVEQIRERKLAQAQIKRLSQDLLEASEAQLQHSKERFRQLLDVVPAAIYATDVEGRILEYNQAATTLWGRRPEPGTHAMAFYDDFDLKQADGLPFAGDRSPLVTALTNGKSVRNAEVLIGRSDASTVEVLVNTAPIRDAEGRPWGAINCLIDVTELSRTRHELSANRQLAQATLDALSAHICVLDAHGTIVAVNVAWRNFGIDNSADGMAVGEGANYLETCRQALNCTEEDAERFVRGLREVINGQRDEYLMEYACDSPREQCWFVARVTRFALADTVRLVVAHENITERKLAEEKVKQSTALLRLAGDMARIGGWAYHVEEAKLVWSDEVAAIHRVSPRTSLTITEAIAFYAPEWRDRISGRFNACVERGESFDEELQIISAHGQRVWVRAMGVAVRDDGGSILRVQGAFQDISARKRQEERLARTAERLTTTLESITDAFFTVDRDWNFTYVNREAERILQRTRSELLGNGIWSEFPAALGTQFEWQYRAASDEHRATQFESYYPPLGVWVEVHAYPSEEGLAVYFRDVTKRKHAELELRKSEQSLRLAVTAGGLGTWRWDTATNEVTVSDQTRVMFGLPTDAVMTFEDFVNSMYPDDRAQTEHLLQQAVANCSDFRADYRIVRSDGSIRWLAGLGRAYADDDREGVRIEGVNLDITERKHTERELLELNEQLEQRVDQRTRELAAATQQAESANEAKSAFLATMSHEIRTPMNGIVGMVDVLSHGRLSEHQSDAVQTIRESAFALLRLIDDVLDFSKIEAGKLELERIPVMLSEVAEGVCDTLNSLADSKSVDLFLFVSPEGPARVWSDPVRLRQILYNLVGNAIKFSGGRPATRGRVELRVSLVSTNPCRVRIQVADNGIGMSPEVQRNLFQSFRQAEISTTRRFGGSGLGLAICKRLVTLMDGEISVSSAAFEGSVFTVELPVEALDGGSANDLPDLHGVNYVLVTGPYINVEDLQIYLECAGARAHIVHAGVDAVGICKELSNAVVVHGLVDDASRAEWVSSFAHLSHVRHLLILRGRRRVARLAGPRVVTIDGNSLRRRSLLHAAAVAAGRASPEARPTGAESNVVHEAFVAPTVAEARAAGQLILVAEDDSTNQKVLLRQLELLGYAAEVASNGVEALELWRKGGYALLLTDMHMPMLDGYGLTSVIRQEESGDSRMPILALTANALTGEASRARAAGFDEYLTKPMQLLVLREVLEKWLPHNGATVAEIASRDQEDHPQGRDVLDIDVLKRLVGGAPSMIGEMLTDYEQSLRGSLAALQTAAASGDLEEVGIVSHRLKSSSRAIGALSLGDLCAELENAFRLADRKEVRQLVASLEPVAEQVLGRIRLYNHRT